MKKVLLLFFTIVLFFNSYLYAEIKIYISYYGYYLTGSKAFICNIPFSGFFIKDAENGKVVYNGKLTKSIIKDKATGENSYIGDFTELRKEGKFFIELYEGIKSDTFKISTEVYNLVFQKVLHGLFSQRCGMELDKKFISCWSHDKCHWDDADILEYDGSILGHRDFVGGWHDAGDFGKYSNNGAYTAGFLLESYQIFKDNISSDRLNIAESGNGIPDILDEAKYEIDFLLKMQRDDGAVYHQLRSKGYGAFIMPEKDPDIRYTMPVSSASTAATGALFALGARIYREYLPEFSDTLMSRALLSWDFLEKYPAGVYYNLPPGVEEGGYPDRNFKAEKFWLACELFINTGEEKYRDYINEYVNRYNPLKFYSSWDNPSNFGGISYLVNEFENKDSDINTILLNNLRSLCDKTVAHIDSDGFLCPIEYYDYGWGSNLFVLDLGFDLVVGSRILNEDKYFEYATNAISYMLGRNINDKIFITGEHPREVKHPHHSQCIADKIELPVEGLVVEGPDGSIYDDPVLPQYFTRSTPPAKCYIDDDGSWASNEPDINLFGAMLALLSGYVSFYDNIQVPEVVLNSPLDDYLEINEDDSLIFNYNLNLSDSIKFVFRINGKTYYKLDSYYSDTLNFSFKFGNSFVGNNIVELIFYNKNYIYKNFVKEIVVNDINFAPEINFITKDTVVYVEDTLNIEFDITDKDNDMVLVYLYKDGKLIKSSLASRFSSYQYIPSNDDLGAHIFKIKANDGTYVVYDSIVVQTLSPTSINESDNLCNSVLIYPTVFKDFIIIDNLPAGKSCNLEIFNLLGKLVYRERVCVFNKLVLSSTKLSDLSSGIYFIRIDLGKQVITHKIIKIK